VKGLVRFAATLGPVGYTPIAPATAGSLITAAIGWFLPVPSVPIVAVALVIGTALAVWVCGEAEKDLGHDAHPIVADEVIGQSVALLGAPHSLIAFGAAFVLFRIFDVWKPLGAYQAQRLPGGLGVVADDVIAGITSCATLILLRWGLARAGLSIA
jgi:phosphatidylglycerophosphatase A